MPNDPILDVTLRALAVFLGGVGLFAVLAGLEWLLKRDDKNP